jgi:hypothetical protein
VDKGAACALSEVEAADKEEKRKREAQRRRYELATGSEGAAEEVRARAPESAVQGATAGTRSHGPVPARAPEGQASAGNTTHNTGHCASTGTGTINQKSKCRGSSIKDYGTGYWYRHGREEGRRCRKELRHGPRTASTGERAGGTKMRGLGKRVERERERERAARSGPRFGPPWFLLLAGYDNLTAPLFALARQCKAGVAVAAPGGSP